MCNKYIFLVTLTFCQLLYVLPIPLSTNTPHSPKLDEADPTNKTTEKITLEERQTESIKRVIAEHQDTASEYPLVMKTEPEREIDKISLEQLKIKCQHLSRLFGTDKTSQTPSTRPPNHKYPDVQSRPVYYPTKPSFHPIRYPQQPSKLQGFYVTSKPVTTKKPPTTTVEPTTPIKYIRLEPVILQKTILADGRTVYLWHKSLPTALEYPLNYSPQHEQTDSTIPYENSLPGKLGYSPQYGYYYDPNHQLYANNYLRPEQSIAIASQPPQQVTTETSTSTTTEDSHGYGYGFSNFIPFYSYRQESSSSSTTEPSTTTTTSTTPSPIETASTSDILYAQQLKFVVPVPVDDAKGTIPVRDPWNFDPYVYYPKPLQPSSINVQVPYNPMFHVIKAVKVPSLENKELSDVV